MGKARRMKKERRENPEKFQEKAEEMRRESGLRKAMLWGIPLGGIVAAAGSHYLLEADAITGIALLVGAGGWIVVYLSELGKAIPPKDSGASAAIEFGRSR